MDDDLMSTPGRPPVLARLPISQRIEHLLVMAMIPFLDTSGIRAMKANVESRMIGSIVARHWPATRASKTKPLQGP